MKKYFTKENKEVKIGEPIHVEFEDDDNIELITSSCLTKDLLTYLVLKNVIIEKNINEPPTNVGYYIGKLSERLKFSSDDTTTFIDALSTSYPVTVVSLLGKEIAVELEKKYNESRSKCTKLYVLNLISGNIESISNNYRNLKNVLIFRTKEDAYFAMKVLKKYYDKCFS